MRNFKKAIALVMIFALMLGTIASANVFPDVTTENSYIEEIELLADLKVLQGRADGTYDPTGTLTRVEAAAVIFRILTARESATMYEGPTKFWDVADSYWGTGYINYCADIGAIGGYPDLSFRPDQPVTVGEFISMLVRALGLTEGRTNLSYPGGYIAIADANLINQDVPSIGADTPANRALVAKLTYNTMVFATYQTVATRDDPTPKLIERIFRIFPSEGIVTGVRWDGIGFHNTSLTTPAWVASGRTDAENRFMFQHLVPNTTVTNRTGSYTFSKITKEMVGQKMRIFLRADNAGVQTVFAAVTSMDNNVVEIPISALKLDNAASSRYYYEISGVKTYVTLPTAYQAYTVDGASVANMAALDVYLDPNYAPSGTNITKLGKNELVKVTLISNDGTDNTIEYVRIQNYEYSEFEQVTSTKLYTKDFNFDIKSAGGTAYDVKVEDGIVAGDRVIAYKSAAGEIAEVLKVEKVSATLDGTSGAAVAGTLKYIFNGVTRNTVVGKTDAEKMAAAENIGTAGIFYVTPFFNLVAETSKGIPETQNYYYIKDINQGSSFNAGKTLVRVVDSKGVQRDLTVKSGTLLGTLDISNFASNETAIKAAMTGNVCVLTVSTSNEITAAAILTAALAPAVDAGTKMSENAYTASSGLVKIPTAGSTTTTARINDDSVTFVVSGNDVYAFQGTFPAVRDNDMNALKMYVKDDSFNTVKAAVVTTARKPGSSTNAYGMIANAGDIIGGTSGNVYLEISIAMNGEIKKYATQEVPSADSAALRAYAPSVPAHAGFTTVTRGDLVEFELLADGKIAIDGNKNAFESLGVRSNGTTGSPAVASTVIDGKTGQYGFLAARSGNLIVASNMQASNSTTDTTRTYTMASDVKVYTVDADGANAKEGGLSDLIVISAAAAGSRTKVMFVFDTSSTDSTLQRVTEIYVVK